MALWQLLAQPNRGPSVTDNSALHMTPRDQALTSTSAAVLVVIGLVKADDDLSPFFYSYLFQCGKKSEIPSTPDNIRPSGYYA